MSILSLFIESIGFSIAFIVSALATKYFYKISHTPSGGTTNDVYSYIRGGLMGGCAYFILGIIIDFVFKS